MEITTYIKAQFYNYKNIIIANLKLISFNRKNLYQSIWLLDRISIGLILLLISLSSFELISSLQAIEWRMGKELFLFKKHLIVLFLFFIGVIFLSQQKLEFNVVLSLIVGICSIFLCIAVLLFGTKINGSARWIKLLGFTIQPSVFLKNTIGIFSPFLFSKINTHLIFLGFSSLIVLLEPDFGMALLISSIVLTQIFITYDNLFKYKKWLLLPGVFISFFFLLKGRYILLRISKFFSNDGLYQSNIALINLKNSSFFGKFDTPLIPDSHCDFIFAAITAHYGLFIGVGIVFTFLLFFVRNIQQCTNLPFYKKIIVYGILSQIAYQSLFHIASNMSFIPPKGVSCPFLSSGGSEILASIFSVGVLLSITKKKLY